MDNFFKVGRGIINHMKWIWALLLLPALIGGIFSPETAAAQSDFVSCSGPDCTACDLLSMISDIVFWLAAVFVLIAIGIVMYAGFKLVTSGGNMTAKDAAKDLLINGLIGLVIVLAGWFIVDTIIKILLNDGTPMDDYGMWHDIDCSEGQPPVTGPPSDLFQTASFGVEGETVNVLRDTDVSERHLAGGARAGGTCDVIDDPDNACHPDNLGCFGGSAEAASSICSKESGGEPVMSSTDRCRDGRSFSGGAFQVNVLAHSSRIPGCDSSSFTTSGGGSQGSCVEERTNSNGVTYCAVWNCEFTSQSAYEACQAGALDPDLNLDIACELYDETGGFDPWRLSANLCDVTEGVGEWSR